MEAIDRLPMHGGANRKAGPDGARRPCEQPPLVVVIDDNRDLVEAMVEALSDRGHRVLGYRSAQEALSMLEGLETPALIVFDLMMPQMDGWTFRVKQKASPKLRDVPVIVMTASGSPQAEAIDADVFLRKPLSVDRFCAAVEQTIATYERRALFARSVEI
jgi:CheY-like chemotaxis protein